MEEPAIGPHTFDITLPVNQTIEANGVEITSKSVVDSPVRPIATVCFEQPDSGNFSWSQYGRREFGGRELGGGCWLVGMDRLVRNSRAVVTITKLFGMPLGNDSDIPGEIKGPWKFEVELPEN